MRGESEWTMEQHVVHGGAITWVWQMMRATVEIHTSSLHTHIIIAITPFYYLFHSTHTQLANANDVWSFGVKWIFGNRSNSKNGSDNLIHSIPHNDMLLSKQINCVQFIRCVVLFAHEKLRRRPHHWACIIHMSFRIVGSVRTFHQMFNWKSCTMNETHRNGSIKVTIAEWIFWFLRFSRLFELPV